MILIFSNNPQVILIFPTYLEVILILLLTSRFGYKNRYKIDYFMGLKSSDRTPRIFWQSIGLLVSLSLSMVDGFV